MKKCCAHCKHLSGIFHMYGSEPDTKWYDCTIRQNTAGLVIAGNACNHNDLYAASACSLFQEKSQEEVLAETLAGKWK